MKLQDNEETKQSDNMDLLKQQAESGHCGSSCACRPRGSSGKARWVIRAVVLIAAGALAVEAMNKPNGTTDQAAAGTFSLPVPNTTPAVDKTAPAESTPAESARTGFVRPMAAGR